MHSSCNTGAKQEQGASDSDSDSKCDSDSKEENEAQILNGEVPDGLHPNEYARHILETISFPITRDSLGYVGAAVEAEHRTGKSLPEAYKFVLDGTIQAKAEGWPINRFFFQDALYRAENRKAKSNGKSKPTNALRGGHTEESRARYAKGADVVIE